jgi:hypothetical protein
MPDHTQDSQAKPPAILALAITIASAAALVGALAGGGVAAFALPQILWASLGFSIVAATAAVLGVLTGLGRFNQGVGMAALCVAGAVAVSAGFSMIDMGPNLADQPTLARLLRPWAAAQALAGGVVAAAGGLAVLARRPASWKSIGVGLAFLIPAVAIVGGIAFGSLGRRAPPDPGVRAHRR